MEVKKDTEMSMKQEFIRRCMKEKEEPNWITIGVDIVKDIT